MADSLRAGTSAGPEGGGSPSGGAGSGTGYSPGASDPPSLRDPVRDRPRPRVLLPSDIDRHEQEILQAFRDGDPQQAWDATQRFIRDVRHFSNEAARDRLRQNLGTAVCGSCDGLKAGPDVVATCFQIGQCFYQSRKASDATSVQQSLIARLTK
jgi:hypothetical protein